LNAERLLGMSVCAHARAVSESPKGGYVGVEIIMDDPAESPIMSMDSPPGGGL